MRNEWLPLGLNEHLRIVERTRGRINHVPLDSPVLARHIRLLAELNEVILSRESLPTLHSTDPRRINSSGRVGDSLGCRRTLNRHSRAIGRRTVDRTWNLQVRGQRVLFVGVRQKSPNCGVSAGWIACVTTRSCTVRRSTGGVYHVCTGILIAGGVCFHHVPVE